MKKSKSYTVQLNLKDVLVHVDIRASSLEEALESAKTIGMRADILQKDIEWMEGDLIVTGVFE